MISVSEIYAKVINQEAVMVLWTLMRGCWGFG